MSDETSRTKIQVGVVLMLGALVWWLVLLLHRQSSPLSATLEQQLSAIGTAISVVTMVVVAFRRRLWKWRVFHSWLVDVPIVEGRWSCTVARKAKEGASSSVHVEAIVVIEQPTMSTVRYVQTMKNETAEGHTEACQLYRSADGYYYLEGLYQVTKREDHTETAGKRLIYYGAMRLQLDHRIFPSKLKGSYWSDFQTRGAMVLERTQ
jgi:hypothetical protein